MTRYRVLIETLVVCQNARVSGQEGRDDLCGRTGGCYNWCWPCWPHDILRVASESVSLKWWDRTPAMAAGLTDHIWSMDELLGYQVPPPVWVPPKRRGRKPKNPPIVGAMRRPRGYRGRSTTQPDRR